MTCGRCCEDMRIPVQHLLMPTIYLDADGLAFYRAHGLDRVLQENQEIHFVHQGATLSIRILALLFPRQYLDAGGLAFYEQHDLGALVASNTTILLLHTCDQLTAGGLCSIYAVRPTACRAFQCDTRTDCVTPEGPTDVPQVYPLELRH